MFTPLTSVCYLLTKGRLSSPGDFAHVVGVDGTVVSAVAVLGCGYVGLTTGACLAELGHDVVCADVDRRKLETLQRGDLPFVEPELEGLVASGMAAGRLQFVVGGATAVAGREFVFVCVPTPRGADDAPDLRCVRECILAIASALAPSSVVVTKSTVPVGATAMIEEWIGRSDVRVVANPEFLREGSAVRDFMHPDRIVAGAEDQGAAARVLSLYASLGASVVLTDSRTAEVLKYAANGFLAMRLSFINAVALLCDALGADIDGVVAGLGYDHRIGHHFLQPGPGWGGSCLPKDTRALVRMAADAGVSFDLLQQVIESNECQIAAVVSKIRSAAGGMLRGSTVAVFGLAFKANTDDLRESPAMIIVDRLLDEGATVQAYDPAVRSAGMLHLAATPYEAAADADVVAVLTDWDEFRELDVDKLAAVLRGRAIVDARNMLDKSMFVNAGYAYVGLGR